MEERKDRGAHGPSLVLLRWFRLGVFGFSGPGFPRRIDACDAFSGVDSRCLMHSRSLLKEGSPLSVATDEAQILKSWAARTHRSESLTSCSWIDSRHSSLYPSLNIFKIHSHVLCDPASQRCEWQWSCQIDKFYSKIFGDFIVAQRHFIFYFLGTVFNLF